MTISENSKKIIKITAAIGITIVVIIVSIKLFLIYFKPDKLDDDNFSNSESTDETNSGEWEGQSSDSKTKIENLKNSKVQKCFSEKKEEKKIVSIQGVDNISSSDSETTDDDTFHSGKCELSQAKNTEKTLEKKKIVRSLPDVQNSEQPHKDLNHKKLFLNAKTIDEDTFYSAYYELSQAKNMKKKRTKKAATSDLHNVRNGYLNTNSNLTPVTNPKAIDKKTSYSTSTSVPSKKNTIDTVEVKKMDVSHDIRSNKPHEEAYHSIYTVPRKIKEYIFNSAFIKSFFDKKTNETLEVKTTTDVPHDFQSNEPNEDFYPKIHSEPRTTDDEILFYSANIESSLNVNKTETPKNEEKTNASQEVDIPINYMIYPPNFEFGTSESNVESRISINSLNPSFQEFKHANSITNTNPVVEISSTGALNDFHSCDMTLQDESVSSNISNTTLLNENFEESNDVTIINKTPQMNYNIFEKVLIFNNEEKSKLSNDLETKENSTIYSSCYEAPWESTISNKEDIPIKDSQPEPQISLNPNTTNQNNGKISKADLMENILKRGKNLKNWGLTTSTKILKTVKDALGYENGSTII